MDRLINKASDYNLLIVEKSSGVLEQTGEDRDYVLEGVFGEIDVKNKNNRIYTEDEYLPQIQALQDKIGSSKLLGELDHPQQFDISLKNVSHVVEELRYDQDNKKVMGKIRLLDTDAGRQAKALVDAGVPLHISSRAAGEVSEGGKVKIKQLFTYDLVADPGFENAQLKRVNESFGFDNDDNLFIYEVFKKEINKTNENKKEQKMEEFVKTDDFNNYTKYLAEQIKGLKSALTELSESSNEGSASTNEDIETVTAHNDHIVESINNLTEYVKYVAEKTNSAIDYTEYVAEKTDQAIQYTEHVAEKADQGISYTEHVAESVANLKDYANYLAETYNGGEERSEKLVEYVNYLKDNVQNVSEYANYIAESINEQLVTEGDDVVAKEFDKSEEDNELEKVGNNSGEPNKATADDAGVEKEDIEDERKDVTPVGPEGEHEEATDKAPENEGEDGAHEPQDPVESYKSEISSKLSQLLEKASAKKNENPHFFRLVSSTTAEKYNELNEEAKTSVRGQVEEAGFLTESQIVRIIENVNEVAGNETQPLVISAMPAEYKEKWNTLSETKQKQLIAQSKMHKVNTEYQVRNFWQTRDMRETAPVMEKVEMINESNKEEVKQLPYKLDGVKEAIAKKFKK